MIPLKYHARPRRFALALASLVLSASITQPVLGEEEERVLEVGKWYPSLRTAVLLSQSSFSDNWSGGDNGSMRWTATVDGELENQLSPGFNWNNTLKLAFGQTHAQSVDDLGKKVWDHPQKSTDVIELESVGRFTRGWHVDPYISARFASQFIDATDPNGRDRLFEPLRFQEAVGVAKKFVNLETHSVISRFGASFRQHVRHLFVIPPTSSPELPVTDTETVTKFSQDGGLEFVTDVKTNAIHDKIEWISRLAFYQTLMYSAQNDFDKVTTEDWIANGIDPDVKDFNKALDVNWENTFIASVTKLISVELFAQVVYDKYDNSVVPVINDDGTLKNPSDIRIATRKAGQFKQTLGLGLSFKLL